MQVIINQNNQINLHFPMVYSIALDIYYTFPAHLLLEDLIQTGMLGLLDALNRFDSSKGASFKTYAGIRIRGAIVDEIRQYDWLPRSIYQKLRDINITKQRLAQQYGKPPSDQKISQTLGISMKAYHKALLDDNNRYLFAYHELDSLEPDNCSVSSISNELKPDQQCEKIESYRNLIKLLDQLSLREKKILFLHYCQECKLKEIGMQLHLSESRICQLHMQAVNKLREAWQFKYHF